MPFESCLECLSREYNFLLLTFCGTLNYQGHLCLHLGPGYFGRFVLLISVEKNNCLRSRIFWPLVLPDLLQRLYHLAFTHMTVDLLCDLKVPVRRVPAFLTGICWPMACCNPVTNVSHI